MTTSATKLPEAFGPDWLRALRVYLAVIAAGNLVWETLQLPLYTIWTTGTAAEQAFAVLHCTAGDLLIALSALTVGLLLFGKHDWPRVGFGLVAAAAIVCGLAYTVFSEWLNVVVRASWAYSARMPVVSLFGLRIGVSPMLQWLVVPAIAFAITKGAIVTKSNGGRR